MDHMKLQEKLSFFIDDNVKTVYRYFKEAKHADAFANGSCIRLSTLEICRKYEDKEQGDSGEAFEKYTLENEKGGNASKGFVARADRAGVGISQYCHNMTVVNCSHTIMLEDAHVLCTTTKLSEETANNFGPYCVKITDLKSFFYVISQEYENSIGLNKGILGTITYTDREFKNKETPPGPMGFVKPVEPYAKQNEYRFLWRPKSAKNITFKDINCPAAKEFCERIT